MSLRGGTTTQSQKVRDYAITTLREAATASTFRYRCTRNDNLIRITNYELRITNYLEVFMPWIAGQRLQNGKYVIEQVLGQGGFGITYKALQVELNRSVVIKTPNEFLSHDPEYDKYVERFIKEGLTLARLSQDPHPHIVGVIDLFQEGATHCLVMDFVPGENLFEAVKRRGALPEAEILPCIRQIGEALTVVHQAGLVHRDAHPGNIMLRSNGKAVLIDFGIAKGIKPKTLSTTNKAGNQGFAPYEQMTRGSREPKVDIYCLAATLYYAVTGQFPETSLFRKYEYADNNNDPLIPPKQINRAISQQLNQAILKGMALEAKDRPQSMQAWLAMLEAPKAAPPHPGPKPTRTIPWGWLVAILSCYLLIGYLLAVSNAPLWAVAVAAAVIFFAMDKAAAQAGSLFVAVAVVMILAVAGAVILAMAMPGAAAAVWAWAVALAAIVAGAVAGALIVAVAEAGSLFAAVVGAVIVAVVVALSVAWSGAVAWSIAWVVAWVAAVAGAVIVAVAEAETRETLEKSFKFHTIRILAGTSSLGLFLGWVLTKVYTP